MGRVASIIWQRKLWITLAILLLSSIAMGQDDFIFEPEMDTIAIVQNIQPATFQAGIELYNLERYWDALKVFQELHDISRRENRFYTVSTLMLIKTYLRLGDIDNSLRLGKQFTERYRSSAYYDDVLYTIAEAHYRKGDYQQAIRYYLEVIKEAQDQRLRRKSQQTIEIITEIFLTSEDLLMLRQDLPDYFDRTFLSLKLAEKYHREGDNRLANREMRQVRPVISGSYLQREFEQTSSYLQSSPAMDVFIGVILPLTGPRAEIGKQLLNGLRHAIYRYRKSSNLSVSAIVLDNHCDPVKSIKQIEYLVKNPRVVAIFGPVTSENAIPMAALANREKIPMITPTATHSELSDLGPYVFQANLDYTNLGRFLGMYSRTGLGIETVATLSPADPYGKEVTDAFCGAIDEKGGSVATQQWYINAPQELKHQFSSIRKIGLEMMREQRDSKKRRMYAHLKELVKTDSTWHSDSLYLLVRPDDAQLFSGDSVIHLTPEEALIYTGLMDSSEFQIPRKDSLEFKISSIHGLMLPSRFEDVKLIAPQIAYYNLNTTVLGSANWMDLGILRKHRSYLDSLTMVTDYYIDEGSPRYKQFVQEYAARYGYLPSRFDFYGYDTMAALLGVLRSEQTSRDAIHKGLQNMPIYHGICRNISFRGNRPRVNSCAFILSFVEDEIRQVARIENGNLIVLENVSD